MARRRVVPEYEREAIAAEINALLCSRNEETGRAWTTGALGKACGNLVAETIRKAQDPDGVGPAVRDAILAITRTTMGELLAKHGIKAEGQPGLPGMREVSVSRGASIASGGFDRMAIAKRVIEALKSDGIQAADARMAVGNVAFEEDWTTEFELYRKARVSLDKGTAPNKSPRKRRA